MNGKFLRKNKKFASIFLIIELHAKGLFKEDKNLENSSNTAFSP
ncbi:hypothetical protein NEOC95_001109 [Neochlamydia sp. AcF95]|nr:hypothetical protein [Neochlamydia sp. AcF95]